MRTKLLLRVVGFLMIATFILCVRTGGQVAQSAGSDDQTLGQTGKNIKVLTNLPTAQLFPVMSFFETSLGVRCNFCHVNKNGQWDFVSDEKPEKSTARKMIRLVLDTNNTTFGGNTDLTCYTCHRGSRRPQRVPDLPLTGPLVTLAQALQAQPANHPALPAVEEILARYLSALGGQESVDRLKSRHLTGNVTQLNGVTGEQEVFQFTFEQDGPDRFYQKVTLPQFTTEAGFDGATGWQKTGANVRTITGSELQRVRATRGLFSHIKLREQFTSMRVEQELKLGDRAVYVVEGTANGKDRQQLYFDVETGLLLRRVFFDASLVGQVPEQWDFEDYREVAGVKFPFRWRVSSIDSGNPVSTRAVVEMNVNVPVDESAFKPPVAKPAAP